VKLLKLKAYVAHKALWALDPSGPNPSTVGRGKLIALFLPLKKANLNVILYFGWCRKHTWNGESNGLK